MIADAFRERLNALIRDTMGPHASISHSQAVSGGDIHRALKLSLNDGVRLFLKYNQHAQPDLFEREALGLTLIASTNTLAVPEVIGFDNSSQTHPAFLLLEWIEPKSPDKKSMAAFGQALSKLHQHTNDFFGLDHDNFIGPLPQSNSLKKSWTAFYREHRLQPVIAQATKQARLSPTRKRKLHNILDRLESWIDGTTSQPALLHGDLWRGNFIVSERGVVVVDPAVYYGHREAEIAFTELFGGFSDSFYQGYRASTPLPEAYENRKPLYQLYPLLVHLVLFGETYGAPIDRILNRFAPG